MKFSSDLNQFYWIHGRSAESISKFLCLEENHHHSFSLWSCSVTVGRGRLKFRVFPPQPSPDGPLSTLRMGIICSLHQGVMCFSKTWNSCCCKIQILFTEKPMFHSWGTNSRHLHGSGTITFIFFPTLLPVHLDINLPISQPLFTVHHPPGFHSLWLLRTFAAIWLSSKWASCGAVLRSVILLTNFVPPLINVFSLMPLTPGDTLQAPSSSHLPLQSLKVISHFHRPNYLRRRGPDSASQLSCWSAWT